jgi:hypothetical protein
MGAPEALTLPKPHALSAIVEASASRTIVASEDIYEEGARRALPPVPRPSRQSSRHGRAAHACWPTQTAHGLAADLCGGLAAHRPCTLIAGLMERPLLRRTLLRARFGST